ncbi:hypothetical protein D3C81_1695550 [compost metagenome]
MVYKTALPARTELAQVTTHQPIDRTSDHRKQEQRGGQGENGQSHYESKDRKQGRQQIVLHHNVDLRELPLN